MNDFESRSPEWLSEDEPLPQDVLDAIRAADHQDGTAAQVARLEARLAPMFSGGSPGPELGSRAGQARLGSSSARLSLGGGKLLSATVALVGVAALVWPQRERAQRNLPAVSGELQQSRRAEFEPRAAPPGVAEFAHELPAAAANELSPRVESSTSLGASRAQHHSTNALALEARLLTRARRAVEQSPEEAMRLTERHRLRFPHGMLIEEREAIAIKALRRAGKNDAANQRQQRFLQRFPESPHALSLSHGNGLAAASRP